MGGPCTKFIKITLIMERITEIIMCRVHGFNVATTTALLKAIIVNSRNFVIERAPGTACKASLGKNWQITRVNHTSAFLNCFHLL